MHLRPGAETEERLVQGRDEVLPRALEQRLDEGAPHGVLSAGAGPVPVEESAEGDEKVLALARGLAEEHGGTHRGRPRALVAAEQGLEGLAQLVGAMGARVEERELPAVQR